MKKTLTTLVKIKRNQIHGHLSRIPIASNPTILIYIDSLLKQLAEQGSNEDDASLNTPRATPRSAEEEEEPPGPDLHAIAVEIFKKIRSKAETKDGLMELYVQSINQIN